MNDTVLSLFSTAAEQSEFKQLQSEFMGSHNFLIHSLTMKSSLRVRSEAKEIIQILL